MNALVDYGSSDEDDPVPPQTAKAVTGSVAGEGKSEKLNSIVPPQNTSSSLNAPGTIPTSAPSDTKGHERLVPDPASAPILGPASGPASVPAFAEPLDEAETAPTSPYSYERQRLRELTMPRIPNFEIPDAPEPPTVNSEDAAVLDATTKKFERFLALKKQGVHFNERLSRQTAISNPSFTTNLFNVAGVDVLDSYASSLPASVAVRTKWPEECYVEKLIWQNDRREKKRANDRGKAEFVPATKQPT